MLRLCFVCLGNICRSPTAEGIMLHLVQQAGLARAFAIESAGTAAYHVGERPDPRTLATARAHGVELPSRARKWQRDDFERFDLVLAMDRVNRTDLLRVAPDERARAKVSLLRRFEADAAPGEPPLPSHLERDVPDPYYGDGDGFERVFNICEAACRGLLAHMRREQRL